ncbi:MAG TPA: hypothetical protein VMV81_00865, partial [Phycisphaerae bacterium]|nr:hypothetical protein [Phycisphaerae bacterium]
QQFHFGYLISPISYPILPFTGDTPGKGRLIAIRAKGYECSKFVVDLEDWDFPAKLKYQEIDGERFDVKAGRLDKDTLMPGAMPLERSHVSSTLPAKGSAK